MTRTTSRLADGRELIYFDDEPGANRSQSDRRDIAAAQTASEIRHDVPVDQRVIAGHRQPRTHLPPTTQCPLCPSTPDRLTEVPAGDYDVVVFENRFPSLSHGLEPGLGGRCAPWRKLADSRLLRLRLVLLAVDSSALPLEEVLRGLRAALGEPPPPLA